MLGLRSPKVFVISFVTVILCSLTASIAVAQTSPPASTEKATGETSAVVSEPAKVPAATTTAKEETITPPTPIKTETEPAKVNNAAAPSTAPAPAVMQLAPRLGKNKIIVVNLSGRGDKDMGTVGDYLGVKF